MNSSNSIEILKSFKTAVFLLLMLTLLTGLIYPLAVTLLAQAFFPWKANGSLVSQQGAVIGSALIGQSFTEPQYFWSRPSATPLFPYNAEFSSGSNLGPTNILFLNTVKQRIALLRQNNKNEKMLVPVDLVTASASGLDPDISPFAAIYQIPRIAQVRNLPEYKVHNLVYQFTKMRTLGIICEPRVNVLLLNQALDSLRSDDVRTPQSGSTAKTSTGRRTSGKAR